MGDARVRLFVALELPEEVRETVLTWRADVMRSVSGLRTLARESLHVTLCFLGWRFEQELEQIERSCEQAVSDAPAAELSLGRGVWLPPRGPRVLAVELEDEGHLLRRVQSALSTALADGGFYEPEARPFLAHVTVARTRRGERVRPIELPAIPPLRFEGSRVTLYRSQLLRGGAQYQPLATVELGG